MVPTFLVNQIREGTFSSVKKDVLLYNWLFLNILNTVYVGSSVDAHYIPMSQTD